MATRVIGIIEGTFSITVNVRFEIVRQVTGVLTYMIGLHSKDLLATPRDSSRERFQNVVGFLAQTARAHIFFLTSGRIPTSYLLLQRLRSQDFVFSQYGVPNMKKISEEVLDCLQSFQKLKDTVASSGNGNTALDISDELGRFNIWSGNIGAHRSGQSSLEYRLKDASHLRDHVLLLLRSLRDNLQDGKRVCLSHVSTGLVISVDKPIRDGFIADSISIFHLKRREVTMG